MALRHATRLARRHPRYFAHLVRKRFNLKARYRWVLRHGSGAGLRPPPLVYKLMLNWSCNLRCPMCMQWGDVGWVKDAGTRAAEELDWGVVERILDADLPRGAEFILSGGEPLMYSHFGRLLQRLGERRIFATICTNGQLLDRYVQQLDGNPYPTLLISLDGDQPVNDALRGRGVHRRVLDNIERLQRLRRPPFIGIQFTVMPGNVSRMEAFCEDMVARGVDWILLNPGWFLSEGQARDYEALLRQRFDVEPRTHLGYVRHYDCDTVELQRQLERIRRRRWPIGIASYLREPAHAHAFVHEPARLLDNRLCYKQWLRVDVLPDGRVTPCVQFPDLTVGDLTQQDLGEIWQGPTNRRFQQMVHHQPLPICAKCNNIYLYDGR